MSEQLNPERTDPAKQHQSNLKHTAMVVLAKLYYVVGYLSKFQMSETECRKLCISLRWYEMVSFFDSRISLTERMNSHLQHSSTVDTAKGKQC